MSIEFHRRVHEGTDQLRQAEAYKVSDLSHHLMNHVMEFLSVTLNFENYSS